MHLLLERYNTALKAGSYKDNSIVEVFFMQAHDSCGEWELMYMHDESKKREN